MAVVDDRSEGDHLAPFAKNGVDPVNRAADTKAETGVGRYQDFDQRSPPPARCRPERRAMESMMSSVNA
jgi:hypothetical protein